MTEHAPSDTDPADAVHDAAGGAAPPPPDAADAAPAPEVDAVPADAQDGEPGPAPEPEPDWRDRYLRSAAELENVRKRARRDAAAGEVRGLSKLARELLPALDNLDRALAHAEQSGQDPAQGAQSDQELVAGLRLVHGELHAALVRVGVEAFDPTGEPFDPHQHEALSQQPAPEGIAPGTVVAVYQAGYRLRDDVLRAAKVVVAG